MNDAPERRRVIPAREVERTSAPVLVESHRGPDGTPDTIAVIPLAEGNEIRGFDVRCQCGSAVIVECIYDESGGETEPEA